jgi:hypothetical protein
MPGVPDPQELKEAIENSSGLRAHADIEEINRSFLVFVLNANDLIAHLKQFVNNPAVSLAVMSEGGDDAAKRYQLELARQVHNFVSSIKSLIEHTRRIIRRMYEPTRKIRVEYESRGAAFADNPRSRLLQQLREYVLHRELAPTFGSLQLVPSTTFAATWRLDPERLREWKGWDPDVKSYLRTKDLELDLLELVEEYVQAVLDLHVWLYNAQLVEHQADIDATNALVEQLQELLPPLPPPPSAPSV